VKVRGELQVEVTATLELNENEMRVLEYIVGFDAKAVHEHLGTQISEHDLAQAFRDMRAQLTAVLGAANRTREYLRRGAKPQ
jgi:hypothetical protein